MSAEEQPRLDDVPRLVLYVWRTYRRKDNLSSEELEELTSIATEHIARNLHNFNPARGKWSTWAVDVIRRAIGGWVTRVRYNLSATEYQRYERWRRKGSPDPTGLTVEIVLAQMGAVSLDVTGHFGEPFSESIPGDAEDPLDILLRKEEHRLVREAIDSLPERERDVLVSTTEGEDFRSVARRLGVSPQRVSEIRRSAKIKAGIALAKKGISK